MNRIISLDEFILKRQKDFLYASGELTGLLRDIEMAAKIVNREVNKAGLVNILGSADGENEAGDIVQKLNISTNEELIECLTNNGECGGIVLEEREEFIVLPPVESKKSKYVVLTHPLYGSSNIDVNVSVGTIFSIYRSKSETDGPAEKQDFLQSGAKQVTAGYVLYGTSTILVCTTSGRGVNGFTLDPTIGEFCLSHREIKMPDRGPQYSINQFYYQEFDLKMRRHIDSCSDNNLRIRYIVSLERNYSATYALLNLNLDTILHSI